MQIPAYPHRYPQNGTPAASVGTKPEPQQQTCSEPPIVLYGRLSCPILASRGHVPAPKHFRTGTLNPIRYMIDLPQYCHRELTAQVYSGFSRRIQVLVCRAAPKGWAVSFPVHLRDLSAGRMPQLWLRSLSLSGDLDELIDAVLWAESEWDKHVQRHGWTERPEYRAWLAQHTAGHGSR